jgi:hypothetical protein
MRHFILLSFNTPKTLTPDQGTLHKTVDNDGHDNMLMSPLVRQLYAFQTSHSLCFLRIPAVK